MINIMTYLVMIAKMCLDVFKARRFKETQLAFVVPTLYVRCFHMDYKSGVIGGSKRT